MMIRNFLMLLSTWQEEVGAKKIAKKTVKDLWWKRRLDKGIKRLRKDLGIIDAWQTDEWHKYNAGEKC